MDFKCFGFNLDNNVNRIALACGRKCQVSEILYVNAGECTAQGTRHISHLINQNIFLSKKNPLRYQFLQCRTGQCAPCGFLKNQTEAAQHQITGHALHTFTLCACLLLHTAATAAAHHLSFQLNSCLLLIILIIYVDLNPGRKNACVCEVFAFTASLGRSCIFCSLCCAINCYTAAATIAIHIINRGM